MDLRVRAAKSEDMMIYFKWVNDPDVRLSSFDTKTIEIKEHMKWFTSMITSKNAHLYIFENEGGMAVGQVRFEDCESYSVISISTDKEFRGMGIGSQILKLALKEYRKISKSPVLAYIKNNNLQSVKSFEKAGFKFVNEEKVKEASAVIYEFLY